MIYEHDPEATVGYPGEKVDLLNKWRLHPFDPDAAPTLSVRGNLPSIMQNFNNSALQMTVFL